MRLTQAAIDERLDSLHASRDAPMPFKHVPAVDKSKVGERARHCILGLLATQTADAKYDVKHSQCACVSACLCVYGYLPGTSELDPGDGLRHRLELSPH